MMPIPTASTDQIALQPTQAPRTRIEVIDAIRGFALFGIILIHFADAYRHVYPVAATGNRLDRALGEGIVLLFNLKASSIFSFLFGLSFAIQIQSAQQKGQPFAGRFLWRLATLFLIGFLHSLLYTHDILQTYALFGVLLLLCARCTNRQLLVISTLLYLASVLAKIFAAPLTAAAVPIADAAASSALLRFFGIHQLPDLLQRSRLYIIPALFLLGLVAGRQKIFVQTDINKVRFKKLLAWSVLLLVATTLAYYFFKRDRAASPVIVDVLYYLRQIPHASLYVAAIVLLFWQGKINSAINLLVPVGQMGLTIYIMQSALLVLVFAVAPTLIAATGMAGTLVIAVACFGVQVSFARWWMKRFRYGPLEWAWRTAVYGKRQPLRRSDQLNGRPLPV